MSARRLTLATLFATVALLGMAPSAWADSPQGGWTDPAPSSKTNGVPVGVLDTSRPLRGVAEFGQGIAAVSFRLKQDAGVGASDPCSAISQVQPQQKAGGGSSHVDFAFKADFPCNRRYEVSVTVTPVQKPLRNDTDLTLDLFVDVAIAPAVTTGLTASLEGRQVALTWAAGDHEPDFTGFEIRRATGSGAFNALAEVGPGATSFTDADVPAAGGTFRYRVLGMRPGPATNTVVYSASGDTVIANVVPVRETTTTSASDDSSATTAPPATTGSEGDGAGSVHRVFQVPGRETPTTADSGFQETLPFGKHPAPTNAPGGSTAIARFDDGSGDDGQRQTFVLVAGGTAAFSWAMLLRYVSRRAAGG